MAGHQVSDHFDFVMCGECEHVHFTFYDAQDNIICEAVLSVDQLRRAANYGEGHDIGMVRQ